MSRLVCLVLLVVGARLALGCGDDSSVDDAGFDAGLDASTDAAGFDSALDALAPDAAMDSSVDASPDASAPDAGEEGCGSGELDFGWNIPRTCFEAACMDHPTCEAADLTAAGYADHELCGTIDITPSSSLEACMMEPPFGTIPESPPFNCGPVQYEGHVRFFCNGDRTSVAARFVATHTDMSGFSEYFGHEYWAGSGGGSGDARSYHAWIDPNTSRFFGWQQVSLDPGTSTRLQVWFMTGSAVDPGLGMAYTGGFTASVPPPD